MVATYRITVALGRDSNLPGIMPNVVSAYDEYLEESWGGQPDDYRRAVHEARTDYDLEVREINIEIPQAVVVALFAQDHPTVQGEVKEAEA